MNETTQMIDPGEGWRLLQPLELIKQGDQFLGCDGVWKTCQGSIGNSPFKWDFQVRRPVELLQNLPHLPTGIEAKSCQLIAQRAEAGLRKYPTSLAENNAPLSERAQHAAEEAGDMLNYLLWFKEKALRLEREREKLFMAISMARGLLLNFSDLEGSAEKARKVLADAFKLIDNP